MRSPAEMKRPATGPLAAAEFDNALIDLHSLLNELDIDGERAHRMGSHDRFAESRRRLREAVKFFGNIRRSGYEAVTP